MNHQETAKLLSIIQTSYKSHFKDFDDENFKLQINIWQKIFENVTFEEAYTAFMAWISTETFPPMPANLNELIKKAKNPAAFLSAEKAWETVDKAVRKFGWNNQERALDSLQPNVVRAVRSIGGWQKVCATPLGQEWDFLKRNFKAAYDEWQEEDQEQALLPTNVLNRLQSMGQKQLEAKE
jgi:hypothetical protein